jgi:hypothetical protein
MKFEIGGFFENLSIKLKVKQVGGCAGYRAQHSTAQHSTAQHSTAQHSTTPHVFDCRTPCSLLN